MRIRRSEDGVIISLNQDLYNENIVNAAINDFARICRISKSKGTGNHIIGFSGLEQEELEEVAMEFSNYVLALMKRA